MSNEPNLKMNCKHCGHEQPVPAPVMGSKCESCDKDLV